MYDASAKPHSFENHNENSFSQFEGSYNDPNLSHKTPCPITNSTQIVTGFFSQDISTDFDPNSSNLFAYQNFASYPTEMELLNVALVEEQTFISSPFEEIKNEYNFETVQQEKTFVINEEQLQATTLHGQKDKATNKRMAKA